MKENIKKDEKENKNESEIKIYAKYIGKYDIVYDNQNYVLEFPLQDTFEKTIKMVDCLKNEMIKAYERQKENEKNKKDEKVTPV